MTKTASQASAGELASQPALKAAANKTSLSKTAIRRGVAGDSRRAPAFQAIRFQSTTSRAFVFLAAVVMLSPGFAMAQSASKKTTPQRDQLSDSQDPSGMQDADTAAAATLMDQLSKGRYSSRQNATLKMWGARDELREQVQAAARHSNPEVSGRAKWILDQWRRGTSPDMPSNVLRLLQQGDDPAAIVELIELGRFADAVVAVQESAQSIEFDRIKVMVNSALASRFPFYIQQAIQEESLADLLQLIDLSAIGKEMAVCRIRLMQTIGIEIEEDQLLPKAAETWAPARRDESLVAVLNILGRQDESIAVAKKSANASLLRVALMLADDWQSLTDMALESLEQGDDSDGKSKPGSRMLLEETIHWIHALVAADRCGDRKAGEKAIAALSGVRPDHEGFDLAWKALTLHGQIDAVLAMLDRDSPQDLVDVALAASRADAVFENLQYPRAQLETNLESWIDEAVDQQQLEMALIEKPGQDNRGLRRARNNPDRPNVGTERLLALMKCLITVGREDAARQIADRLASEPIVFGSSRDNHPLRDFVLQSLVSTARSEWVFDLAVAEGDQTISRTAKWCTSRLLPDTESMTLDLMLDAMQRMYGKMPFQRRYQMTCELLQGDIPGGFDPAIDFERLFDVLTNRESAGLFARRLRLSESTQINHEVVQFFARHGEAVLATNCLGELVRNGNLEALYELAIQEADSGNAEQAGQLLEMVWNQAKSSGRSYGRARFQDADTLIAMKALVAQWLGAQRAGNADLETRLFDQIRLTMCSPSTEFGDAIAEHLSQHGAEELAEEVYEILLPLTAMGSPEATEFYDVARKYATLIRDQKPGVAIRWFDLAVGGTLESTYFRSSAYVTLPQYLRRWAIEAAIESKDRSAVVEHLDRLMNLDPMDISFAEDVLPKMRDAGMKDLADSVFDRLFDYGKAHCQRYPFDITSGNNIAWVAAINDRRLDEAAVLSEQAVYLEPDSAIYRDTLAEILFRLGRKQEALHVEESCLLDDPTQWHLHQQVDKYRDALADDQVKTPN